MCLLFEYAATLTDVAYTSPSHARDEMHEGPSLSRYDTLQAFRVTKLGAYVLGQSERAPSLARPEKGHLILRNELEIRTTRSLFAADRALLESIAEPVDGNAWRLSRTRVLEMQARGGSLRNARERLARSLGGSLPRLVAAFFKDCQRRSRSVKGGAARLIECRDPSVADEVASHQETSRYCHRAGDRLLVVPLDHQTEFNRALLEAGFGAIGSS